MNIIALNEFLHKKTQKGKLYEVSWPCPNCKENWSRSFNRCGYYSRELLTINGIAKLSDCSSLE